MCISLLYTLFIVLEMDNMDNNLHEIANTITQNMPVMPIRVIGICAVVCVH